MGFFNILFCLLTFFLPYNLIVFFNSFDIDVCGVSIQIPLAQFLADKFSIIIAPISNKEFVSLVFDLNKIILKSIPHLMLQMYIYFGLKRDPDSTSQIITIVFAIYTIHKTTTLAYTYGRDCKVEETNTTNSNKCGKLWNRIVNIPFISNQIKTHFKMIKLFPFLFVYTFYSLSTIFLISSCICISEDKLYLIFLYISFLLFYSISYQIYSSQQGNVIERMIISVEKLVLKNFLNAEISEFTSKEDSQKEQSTFKTVINGLLTPLFIFQLFSQNDEHASLHLFTSHFYPLVVHFISLIFLSLFITVNSSLPISLLYSVGAVMCTGLFSFITIFYMKCRQEYKNAKCGN